MIEITVHIEKERQPITGVNFPVMVYTFNCVHCGTRHTIKAFTVGSVRTHDKLVMCGNNKCEAYLPDVERMLTTRVRRLRYASNNKKREPYAP